MAATDWTALDYDNPAALLAVLRPAYYRLLAGDAEAEVEGTDRRRVRFQPGDAKRLETVIRDLEGRVARASGKRRRFALAARF
jgi:hypothetical protein